MNVYAATATTKSGQMRGGCLIAKSQAHAVEIAVERARKRGLRIRSIQAIAKLENITTEQADKWLKHLPDYLEFVKLNARTLRKQQTRMLAAIERARALFESGFESQEHAWRECSREYMVGLTFFRFIVMDSDGKFHNQHCLASSKDEARKIAAALGKIQTALTVCQIEAVCRAVDLPQRAEFAELNERERKQVEIFSERLAIED